MSLADNPIFHNPEKAREWLEALLWPDGPVCPHCGLIGAAYRMNGKTQRAGLCECKGCEEQFTVTVGTVLERSHIPLHKWVMALHLVIASKKGMSAHQLHRMLGVTYKTAWFMAMRIREALVDSPFAAKLGGANMVVEVDETYVGGKEANKHKSKRQPGRQGGAGKAPVLALVERDGQMRSQHVANGNAKTLRPILHAHIDKASYVMTDESVVYPPIAKEFAGHGTVNLPLRNTPALSSGTPTRSKTTSRSSSAVSSACTITSAKRICTATSASSIFATTSASRSASTTISAWRTPPRASSANGSPIGGLVGPKKPPRQKSRSRREKRRDAPKIPAKAQLSFPFMDTDSTSG